MKRTPVVLLDAFEGLGIQATHALAQTKAYEITAFCLSPTALLRYSRHCHFVHLPEWSWNHSPTQLPKVKDAILFPITIQAVQWVIRHKETLKIHWHLPLLPSLDAFNIVENKRSFAAFAKEMKLPIPSFFAFQSYTHSLDTLPFPALIKPCHGDGGNGIEKYEARDTLKSRLQEAIPHNHILIQSYIEGEDLSCGVLCKNGEIMAATTYQCLLRSEPFGPFGALQVIHDNTVLQVVSQLMRTLRWNGIANVDLKRSQDGSVMILEVNPRVWGNMRSTLFSGINFADLLCRSAFKQLPKRAVSPSTVGCFFNISWIISRFFSRNPKKHTIYPFSWKRSSLFFILLDPLVYARSLLHRLKNKGASFIYRSLRNAMEKR